MAFWARIVSGAFEKQATGAKKEGCFRRVGFQKIQKLLNFQRANHYNEKFGKFLEESQMERKMDLKISGYLARLSSFPEIY